MKNKKLSVLFLSSLVILSACQFVSSKSSDASSVANSSASSNSIEDSSIVSSLNSLVSSYSSESSNTSNNPSASKSSSASSGSSSVSSASSSKSSSSSSASSSYVIPSQDSKWNIDLDLRGNAFRDALEKLITSKRSKTCSYDDNKSVGPAAAAYGNTGKFVPFYHTTDTLTTYSSCNREHTWPDSRGAGKSGPGSDPFIIRPTLSAENNSRGNNFYGLGGSSSKEWDPAVCGFEGSRGESARVIFYAATAYHSSKGFELSNNPGDPTSAKTMGTLKYLIRWNKTYPVTDMEIQINNYLSDHGYGRNPFVDHPEYADLIWNEEGVLNINSVGGGTDVKDPFEDALDLCKDVTKLDGNSFAIVNQAGTNSNYYMLGNESISSDYPWYLKGINVVVNDDMSKMKPLNIDEKYSYWRFDEVEQNKFTLYNATTRKYLYSYIDDTHYSIGLRDTVGSDEADKWTLESAGNGFNLKSGLGVYLEYYTSSFCGYRYTPKAPILLYK